MVHWTVEVFSILLTALGAYVAFGPYHDDRTWNLVRNSAKIETLPVPSQEPTHFSLYALAERSTSKPSLLFIPGHAGSWRQGINLCAYLEGSWNFYVTDFHASASALHWSVLSDQAAFTAAAIHHLGEVHRGPLTLTLLGHSMGGRVALEALKTSRQHVNALILISTPVGPHPLMLDPRFAPEAYHLEGLDVYSLSGGATDPLVPMNSCRERSVRFIPLPAASNVYSSFSHVNLLFSRHSLHFLSRLLGATRATSKGEVPKLSPWLRLNSFTESIPAAQPKVLQNISDMDPVKVTSLASELVEGKMRLWKQPKMGGTFSFLLLEEPRPIRRRPESTTRGETFEATDTLNCSEISLTWRQQDTEQWHALPLIDMQFPAKVCLFQLRQSSESRSLEVLLSSQAPPKRRKTPQRRAWAHWHADPLQASVNCSAALPGLLGWFTTLLWPLRCEFPAGRPLMSRVVLPLPQLPILPLDFRLSEVSLSEEQKNATLWPLILVSAEREEDVRIAALRLHTTPTSSPSWAAESRAFESLFAPRFVEAKEAFSIFVIGHPDLEITLEVRGNIYSALAEFLRTQHFHFWLGACTCFSAQDLSKSRFAASFPVLWIIGTVLLQLLTEVSISPFTAASCKVLDALVALGLASASRRFALFASAVCRPRDRGRKPGYISAMAVILLASIQPAGCTLLLIIACIAQCGANSQASPLLGTSSLLLGPYLLCQLPSMIFAVWLLLGQHKEASAPFLQSKLDRALPSSQHLPTLWADSWLSKDPDLRPVLSLLAPSVTLCCCMAKGRSSAPKAAEWGMLILSVAVTVYAAASSSRLWWACQPVFLAQMLVALASSPKEAKVD